MSMLMCSAAATALAVSSRTTVAQTMHDTTDGRRRRIACPSSAVSQSFMKTISRVLR